MFPVLRATVKRPGTESRDRDSGEHFGGVERRLWPFLHTAVTAGNGQYAPVGKGRAVWVRLSAFGVLIRGTELQSGRSRLNDLRAGRLKAILAYPAS
jgi:hypothetical protein